MSHGQIKRASRWFIVVMLSVYLLRQIALVAQENSPPVEKETYRTRLFFAEPDGSNLRPVVGFAEYQAQGSPAWSLDGKLVAFDGWKPQKGEEFSSSSAFVVDLNGLNPRRIPEAAMPSFSPDGKWVVISNPKRGGVWVAPVANAAPRSYVPVDKAGWGADWSRDGRIVYALGTNAGANLRIVKCVDGNVDGNSEVDVFGEGHPDYIRFYWNMAWSADSQRIAYKAETRDKKLIVGVVDARGEKFGHVTREETDLLASFAWSPDGSRVLFVKKRPEKPFHEVFAWSPDKPDPPQPLPGLDPLRRCSDVAYSPDGTKLLLTCGMREMPAPQPKP